MDTYGEETVEYKEARMNWGERKNDLDKQNELNCGFGELRNNSDVFEKMKKGAQVKKLKGREKSETNYQQYKKRTKMKWKGILGKMKKIMGSKSGLGSTRSKHTYGNK